MITIRSMTLDDYDAVIELMRSTPGISLRDADSREATARYLERNPGMSFVAEADGTLCGCVMCGHDGRRGYLQHLIVLPEYRQRGIAHELVERCLECLEALGIYKCHLDVMKSNEAAGRYWQGQGWTLREDIDRYSKVRRGGEGLRGGRGVRDGWGF
ncbi:GNAT family N-acetyltransferase, partial [Pseudomonas syringae]|uniref:GNAT family N-acetyltransferase n=1 Tax=Pseudomonas syringae TaxID=317 RepID=UPI001F46DB8F